MPEARTEYDGISSVHRVDLQEYIQDHFTSTFDPIPLDQSLAVQAQISSLLNANHGKLLELQETAQRCLVNSRARLTEGLQDAKDVRRDLQYIQKRVTNLNFKASCKHPKEYKQARNRYASLSF
ncbi:hypothetical protein DL95DRAFT_302244 [Leptodontidium sp. 2 PMI_412]|nr:hypothetical protein DL95DRAFT_302244 [Leptodontidium sp. 2 PMI_412]